MKTKKPNGHWYTPATQTRKMKRTEIEKTAIATAANAAMFLNKISHGIACGLNHNALSILYQDAKNHFTKLDKALYELYVYDESDD